MVINENASNRFILIPETTFIHSETIINGEFIIGEKSRVGEGTKIFTRDNMVMVGSNVVIGKNVNIEAYGKGRKTFIGNNTNVQDGARILNACVADYVQVGKNVTIMR
jgi:carbonic anhydrase/acetyltransferase-like protein (isoleucine patch superfamily)